MCCERKILIAGRWLLVDADLMLEKNTAAQLTSQPNKVGKDRSTTTLLLPSLNEPTDKIMALPYSSYISAVFGSRGSQYLMTRRAPGADSMLAGVAGRPTSPRPQLRRTEQSLGPRHDRHGSSVGSDSHSEECTVHETRPG
jgi:hypothetical protein